MDIEHVAELVVVAIASGGIAWGTITAKVAGIQRSIKRLESGFDMLTQTLLNGRK